METEPSWTSGDDQRVPLIVVAGLREEHVEATAEAVRRQVPLHTALVHHDLRSIDEGVVHRTVRHGDEEQNAVLELAHGCVSCTLREDFLPLLGKLSAALDVKRIVVRLDPAVAPEAICWALQHVVVDERTLDEDVDVRAVLTAVDLPTWLTDASGDETLAERGLSGSPDDERTVAQMAVGQVEFADALVLSGNTDPWNEGRTEAVLSRLTPTAPRARHHDLDVAALLARIPAIARRGEVDGPHGRLRGQPTLASDAGVSVVVFEERRPFHPLRLHEALDVRLDGIVRTCGRAWVASQPDAVLWAESAGGGLNVDHAGLWLTSLPPEQWADSDPEHQLRASLIWDDYYADRMQELVVLAHEASPRDIDRALRHALLTDDELAAGEEAWTSYEDPFGEWHVDACVDTDAVEATDAARESGHN